MQKFTNLFFILLSFHSINGFTAFTNNIDCGRVGDQILNVIKTYYISKRHQVPMLLTSFPYANCFNFSRLLNPVSNYQFSKKVYMGGGGEDWKKSKPIRNLKNNTLYIISYYYLPQGFRHLCRIDVWDDLMRDQEFLKEMSNFMKIIVPHSSFVLPEDRVSVAVHIRRVSGPGDIQTGLLGMQKHYPEKFSPLSYFKNAIKILHGLINKPLYLHIFTDDAYPEQVVSDLQKGLEHLDVTYGYRRGHNSSEGNHLINDLAGMLQCDCLIRSKSNFGQIIELCKKYDVVIYPEETRWDGNTLLVTKSITKLSDRAKANYGMQHNEMANYFS